MVGSSQDSISVLQAVTLAIAFVGAVLGIINTWHAIDKSRVKLKVVPAHAFSNISSEIEFSIEVTNLSAFAVTVNDVGVLFHGTKNRWAMGGSRLIDGGKWPRRLEPRSSVTLYGQSPGRISRRILRLRKN